ncbi:CsoR family transcriptional regulator [Lachnoclostridium sp. An169]|uniref:metal-sensing transcriptional repressor n=1 Tax=Lachnoclostridium sp. An169 TaxID=1965569 RepID=UPI000B37F019|nr:metal-sensing transcriptional repressor [Lachnoclostridium sp. An169]OUP85849.1 CsoR family transcriptional regulator [Lachnoclostridium sp. An169]HJA65335.1 metal-sensing transcriptional repressor [Candidatus Mediterraneibacter cottocaccae]
MNETHHFHENSDHSEHQHKHTHTQTKAVVNRLSRAIGHLETVKKMVENGQDCSEVLIQLAAVRAALTNTGKLILKDHLDHCIVDAVSENDPEALEQFKKAIDQFIK